MSENNASKIGKVLTSIARGEVLFTLKCDKFFPHIIYFFFLICIVLITNVMIDKTLVKVEQNKEKLYDLKIYLTHKNSELVKLGRLSTVEKMLESAGSDLGIPENPIVTLEK